MKDLGHVWRTTASCDKKILEAASIPGWVGVSVEANGEPLSCEDHHLSSDLWQDMLRKLVQDVDVRIRS